MTRATGVLGALGVVIVIGVAWLIVDSRRHIGIPGPPPLVPVNPAAMASVEPATPAVEPAPTAVHVDNAAVVPPLDASAHVVADAGRCLAGTGQRVRQQPLAVHRWVDERGILHFSDTPPGAGGRDHRVIEVSGVPPIVINARGHDVNLPSQLSQRVMADAQAIERALRTALGVEGEPGLSLDIVFVQSAEAYARLVPSPQLEGSAGAYASRTRTIFVRWQADEDMAFTILRHELAHALVHERLGQLPVALNEGLAGFFERIAVSGLGAQVAVGARERDRVDTAVSTDGAEELVDLLARDAKTFYAAGKEVRYHRAYALVAMLMAQPVGRSALAAVLAAQRADSCVPVDVGRLLDARYPGGLARVAEDWSRWLRDPPSTVHAF